MSGEVIDVSSIPKSKEFSLEAVHGPEAIQKCHVMAHTGACVQITSQGLSLHEKLADDQSCEILIKLFIDEVNNCFQMS